MEYYRFRTMHTCATIVIGILCVSLAAAQITFTREWAAGKRSAPATDSREQGSHLTVMSLKPAIEFLIQVEKMHRGLAAEDPRLEMRKSYRTVAPMVFRKLKDNLFQQTATEGNEKSDENP